MAAKAKLEHSDEVIPDDEGSALYGRSFRDARWVFFYFDCVERFAEGMDRLSARLKEGQIKEFLDVSEGFDTVPNAALGQFPGANLGKKQVHIADDPMG